jgi:hypothetical protein
MTKKSSNKESKKKCSSIIIKELSAKTNIINFTSYYNLGYGKK